MGAEPRAATDGRADILLSVGFAMPGMGAEPSAAVDGLKRAGSSAFSTLDAAGAGAEANGDGLSKTPDEVPLCTFSTLGFGGLTGSATAGAGLLITAGLVAAC